MEKIKEAEVKKNIGLLLKKKRIEKAISQGELGEKVGVTRTFVNLVENGRRIPSYDTLVAMAAELGEDVKSLIAEAKLGKADPEIKIAHLLAKLLKSGDKKKLTKLVEFAESLG